MAYYDYRGVNEAGSSVSGAIEAESVPDALRILEEQGLREVQVDRAAEKDGDSPGVRQEQGAAPPTIMPSVKPAPGTPGRRSLGWNELAELNEQLLGLVRAGMPLAPSIAAMARFMSGRRGRAVAQKLDAQRLQQAFAWFCALIALLMLGRALGWIAN